MAHCPWRFTWRVSSTYNCTARRTKCGPLICRKWRHNLLLFHGYFRVLLFSNAARGAGSLSSWVYLSCVGRAAPFTTVELPVCGASSWSAWRMVPSRKLGWCRNLTISNWRIISLVTSLTWFKYWSPSRLSIFCEQWSNVLEHPPHLAQQMRAVKRYWACEQVKRKLT